MRNNQNPVAIITGSTSGIGYATARLLAAKDYRIVINSYRSVKAGQAIANALPDATYCQANVADEDACKSLVSCAIDTYGQLDVVINNAAHSHELAQPIPHHDLDAVTDDIFQQNMQTNLMGPWYLSRAAMPHLKHSNNGSIINISSIAGSIAGGSSIPYSVAKAALNHLTKLMAKVAAPTVRINAVAPGFIDTERTANWDSLRETIVNKSLLKRVGKPEEVAQLILQLIENQFFTGEIITLDGGRGE